MINSTTQNILCPHCGAVKQVETGLCLKCHKFPPTVNDLYPDNEAGAFDHLDNNVEDKEADLSRLASENKTLREANTVLLEALGEIKDAFDSPGTINTNWLQKFVNEKIEQANNSINTKQG